MNTHINPAKLTGSSCSCGGSSKSCKCNGGDGCGCGTCQVDTMVRPRFFAGQLLTEDDLQSLEDYVLAKNRLHNRHLFGAGVVCGLEVLCDPCGGGHVAVQPGYALDCCGNDIVLDCRLSLDINAMVRDLRRDQLGGYDCGDPCDEQQRKLVNSTAPVLREYCLYVSYCEQQSDPVSPYAVDEPCNAQSCEPSRIREGIRFELRCPAPASSGPELITAILHCFQDVIGIEAMSVDALSLSTLQQNVAKAASKVAASSYEDLRSRLLDLIDRSPHLVDCKLRERVLAVPPPSTGPTLSTGAAPASRALIEIFFELLKECICRAINPPCAPCDDTGVLLACLKVQDCDVVEICNMHRHFVLAPTTLRYWASFGQWERLIAAWCCGMPRRVDQAPRGIAFETDAAISRGADTGASRRDPAGQPPPADTAPLPEAAAARQLRAIAMAIAGLQSSGSPNAVRFGNVAAAFSALAGETPKPPPVEGISDAARKEIRDAIVNEVKAAANSGLEEIKKANARVEELETQLKAISAKVDAVSRRPARRTGGTNE